MLCNADVDDDESLLGDDSTGTPLTKKQKKEKRAFTRSTEEVPHLFSSSSSLLGGRKNKGPIDVDKQCGVIKQRTTLFAISHLQIA